MGGRNWAVNNCAQRPLLLKQRQRLSSEMVLLLRRLLWIQVRLGIRAGRTRKSPRSMDTYASKFKVTGRNWREKSVSLASNDTTVDTGCGKIFFANDRLSLRTHFKIILVYTFDGDGKIKRYFKKNMLN